MRTTYRRCKFCDDFHDVDNWPDNHREYVPDNRSDLASPMVISDSIELKSMADGKIHTSKRVMRRESRARGFMEVGNEDPGAHRTPRKNNKKEILNTLRSSVSEMNMRRPTRTKKQISKLKRKRKHG